MLCTHYICSPMGNWTPPHRLKVYCLHLSAIGEYVPPLRIELRIFSLRGSSFNHSAIEAFNCTEGRIWTHYLMDISHLHLPLVLPQHYKLKGCGRDSNPISSFTVKHFYQISYPHSSDNRTWTYNYCLMRAASYLLKYIRIWVGTHRIELWLHPYQGCFLTFRRCTNLSIP